MVRSSNTNFVLGRGSEGTARLTLTEDDSTKELRFDTISSNVNWITLAGQSFTAIIGGTSQTLDFKVVVPVGMMAGSYQGTINIPATQYIKGTNQPSRDSDQTRTVTIDLQVLAGNMAVNNGDLDFGSLDQGESQDLTFMVVAVPDTADIGLYCSHNRLCCSYPGFFRTYLNNSRLGGGDFPLRLHLNCPYCHDKLGDNVRDQSVLRGT